MRIQRSWGIAPALLLVGLFGLAGCGGSAVPEPKATLGVTKGKVTYKGTPVADGQIVFSNLSTKIEYVGKLQAGGTYEAQGIPVGDYAVSVGPVPVQPPMDGSKPAAPPDPANIPASYRKADTSGLKTSIKQGNNTFDVDMQ